MASANCGLYCGAKIDFVDIDPKTYNLCPQSLAEKLQRAEQENRLPKIVVAVHLCGQPCDMQAIYALSQRYGFKIIEDASHAIGGKYHSEYIGNCYSDITVFSFHPVKIITTAEGGMALTNTAELANKMNLYRSHGITRDPGQMTHEPDGPPLVLPANRAGLQLPHDRAASRIGCQPNAAVGCFVARRHELAKRDELLADLPVTTPWQHPDSYSGLHLYVIRLQVDKINKTHRQVFEALREQGIGVNLHYIPVHSQPYYQVMDSPQRTFRRR